MTEREYTLVEQWVRDHVRYEYRGFYIHPKFLEEKFEIPQEAPENKILEKRV